MKLFNAHRSRLSVIALLMAMALFTANSAYAQSDASKAFEAPAQVQYSSDELERLRADLIAFVRAYQGMTGTVNPRLAQKFDGIEEQFKKLSATELNVLRNGLVDASILSKTTLKIHGAVEKANLNREVNLTQKDSSFQDKSIGFPDADYPSCGTTRVDDAVIDASDIALFVAEGVRDGASRLCGQVAVVAGFGANTSSACIATDAVYLTAKAVNYGLHYCNDKIDSAEQAATFGRLGHLHTDLETSIANDTTNTATITGAVTTATNTIVNNDNANKTTIVAAVESSRSAIILNADGNAAALNTAITTAQTTIVNNDNANKNTIVNNDNANKNAIITNDNANAMMLTNLLLRTQIESDLAAGDNSTPVGLYVTPGNKCGASAPLNQCGLLDLVRQIVVQTISNLGGSGSSQANSFLAKGDQAKTAGDYKSAYKWYRQAYNAAVK